MKLKTKVVLAVVASAAVTSISNKIKAPQRQTDIFGISDTAFAKSLDPKSIDMSTVAGRGDFARFMYYMVNGSGDSGHSFQGPEGGFRGMINKMTSRMGHELEKAGIATCADIPTSGTKQVTISHPEKGSMTMDMTFAAGSKAIPSHFAKYGSTTYDKRVSMSVNGSKMMSMEFYCGTDTAIKTGYINTNGDQFGKRSFEIYFQNNSTTNSANVDLLQVSADTGSEHLATRFYTTDGDTFTLHSIRTMASGEQAGGHNIAIKGVRSTQLVKLYLVKRETTTVANTTSSLASADKVNCMSFANETAVESTGCSDATDPTAADGATLFDESTAIATTPPDLGTFSRNYR